jgi:hypothetical protein
MSSCKVPVILETWILWTTFLKTLKYQISWKSVHSESSSLRADVRTGIHDEANIHFLAVFQTRLKLQIQLPCVF